jgi:dihydrofolate reductase
MIISLIAAMSDNRVIGHRGKMPWHIPADLKFFKNLTTGHTVIMGRKTFESIGKALPNRQNFVLTNTRPLPPGTETVTYFNTPADAIDQCTTAKAFIIGGGQLFRETMRDIDGIYLTRIHADYAGDTFYPDTPPFFKEKSREKLQDSPLIEVIYFEKEP